MAHRLHISAAVFLATLAFLVAPLTPAWAAIPEQPTGLSPASGEPVDDFVFSWARVSDATSYVIETSTAADFSANKKTYSTVNNKLTPTTQLPAGQIWWRVAAKNASGTSIWATETFQRAAPDAPSLLSPADGSVLTPPRATPVLSWSNVDRATIYNIQVSQVSDFSDPARIKSYTSKTNAYRFADNPAPGIYFWRVNAQLGAGFVSAWSNPTRSYQVLGLNAPTVTAPVDDIDAAVTDVILDWEPVTGAVTYDLEVSTDEEFKTIQSKTSGIKSTRYALTSPLLNDQYYWRIRSIDATGNIGDWNSPLYHFKRTWPDQVVQEYPSDGAVVGDPFFFQWKPLERADTYTVQMSLSPDFSSPESCGTAHPIFTPRDTACRPAAGKTYYWRVLAKDGTISVETGPPSVRSFTYEPGRATLTSPASESEVTVPTLKWEPVSLADRYEVTLTPSDGTAPVKATTYATTYTPRIALKVDVTYRWDVNALAKSGESLGNYAPDEQPTFTVRAQPSAQGATPDPASPGGAYQRFPALTWTPVDMATSYKISIRKPADSGFPAFSGGFAYPAWTDEGTSYLAPGTYEWKVQALKGNTQLSVGSVGTFTIDIPLEVSGYTASLTGTAKFGPATGTCGANLPQECQNLRQTPVLSWDPVPNASSYKVVLSRDQQLTNVYATYTSITNTMFMMPGTLPDSQAGSAYFWVVTPCTPNCRTLLPEPTHAFNKLAAGLQLTSPAMDAAISTHEVALNWQSIESSQDSADWHANTSVDTTARNQVKSYTVEISLSPTFSSIYDSVTTTQTTYTSPGKAYPEGDIYWRVKAKDIGDNPISTSAVRRFVMGTPPPMVTDESAWTPKGPGSTGNVAFNWEPQPYAAKYNLEVYKNGDLTGQAGNLLFPAVSTRQAGFIPTNPIPVSDADYTWRMQAVDADGHAGPWSDFRTFSVPLKAPSLLTPLTDAEVEPTGGLFTWEQDDTNSAASFRWEYRKVGTTTLSGSVTTSGLAWAPDKALAVGNYEWRVIGLDSGGKDLASNPNTWRPFKVSGAPVATTAVLITGTGQVGTVLSLEPPGWDAPNVTTTYQWFRGNTTIVGETGLTYRVVAADFNKQLKVVATGARPGYPNGTSNSNVIVGGQGAPIEPTAPPTITGTPRVGSALTVNPGTWPGTPTYAYQWYRGRTPISGATNSTYTLVAADAGMSLAVLVTASSPGNAAGQGVGGPVAIQKLASSTTTSLSPNKVKAKKRALLTGSVTAAGLSNPVGSVKVFDGARLLRSLAIGASAGGKFTYKLPKLKKGKHKIRVAYSGSVATLSSTRVVTLKVTR